MPSNGPGFDEGTTTNIGGRVQARKKALEGVCIDDWKLVNVMLKKLGDQSNYSRIAKVLNEISQKVPGYQEVNSRFVGKLGCSREQVAGEEISLGTIESAENSNGKLKLRVATYLFAHDKILDASSKLAHHFKSSSAFLNESDAKRIDVSNGDRVCISGNGTQIEAEVIIDNRCMEGGVVVPKISDEQGVKGLENLNGSPAWVDVKEA